MAGWQANDIGDLAGTVAVVTGANAGLGYETALALAAHGAHVVVAARDPRKGDDARRAIAAEVSGARLEPGHLDLADLASVEAFATAFLDAHPTLDILVNNAGARLLAQRTLTADGFETQFGINHLGHFALTARLLPALLARPGARVVTVTSIEHYWAHLDFDDLQSERKYSKSAYGRSKLANLLFTHELQRRADAAGRALVSVAAHPGWADTTPIGGAALVKLTQLVGQPAARGALPSLYAATAPDVVGGDLIAPGGPGHLRGYPVKIGGARRGRDPSSARRLWEVSTELTGVTYQPLERAGPGR